MSMVDEASWIGQSLLGLNDITGSLFLSLLLIFIFLTVICLALRIPPEASAIILIPLALMSSVYGGSQLLILLVVILIYVVVAWVRYMLSQS